MYGSKNGAVEWIRTTDLLITNQLLYQLSYNSTADDYTVFGAPAGSSLRSQALELGDQPGCRPSVARRRPSA